MNFAPQYTIITETKSKLINAWSKFVIVCSISITRMGCYKNMHGLSKEKVKRFINPVLLVIWIGINALTSFGSIMMPPYQSIQLNDKEWS